MLGNVRQLSLPNRRFLLLHFSSLFSVIRYEISPPRHLPLQRSSSLPSSALAPSSGPSPALSPLSPRPRAASQTRRSHPSGALGVVPDRLNRLLEEDAPGRELLHERELTTSSKLSASLDNLSILSVNDSFLGSSSSSASTSSSACASNDGAPPLMRVRSFSGPLLVQVRPLVDFSSSLFPILSIYI